MKSNLYNMDRIVRALIGIVLIGATLSGAISVWGWLGVVLLVTAAFSFCSLCAMLGINTWKACLGGKPAK